MPATPIKAAYDLLVLIDPDALEERRAQILEGVKKQIDAGEGAVKGSIEWGVRKLAYEIGHRPEAYYHLFQIEAGPELLKQLEHSLAIDDAVLRHRFIRLPRGAPEHPPKPPASSRPSPATESGAAEAASEEQAQPA
jgi:small subunit ribosomal protein S6